MDLGLEELLATTDATIKSNNQGKGVDRSQVGDISTTKIVEERTITIGAGNPQDEQKSNLETKTDAETGSSPLLPDLSSPNQGKHYAGKPRPKTTAFQGGSKTTSMVTSPPPLVKRPQTTMHGSKSAPNFHGNNARENMSPARAHMLPQFDEAKDLITHRETFARWLRREAVKSSCIDLGIDRRELKERSLDSFRREPNRPFDVPPYIQMQRFKHHEKRRVAKVALVLADIEDKRKQLMGEIPTRSKPKLNDEDLRRTFDRTVINERRRMDRLRRSRTKAWGVLMNENSVLEKIRSRYSDKLQIQMKRDAVLSRRKKIQQEQMARKKKAKAEYAKKIRKQADARYDAKIASAKEEMMKNKKRAEDIRRRMAKEKNIRVVDQDAVQRRRDDIKKRVNDAMTRRAEHATRKREAAERRLRIREEERRRKLEQERERRALKALDQAEQVRMNRNALLARQAKALEERNAWQKRMALLAELETAVKHERQMYQKERRKMEWERKQRTIFLREQLPGPGEYEVPTTIGKGKGAAKWGTHNPKNDVEWAIYYAKDLPGPGQYTVPSESSAPCARFSQFTPKSDVDWLIYYASQKPGPGEYEPKPVASRAGVTFSKFTPKGEIDKIQERAQELPGPSDYSATDLRPVKRRSLGELKQILGAGADVSAITTKMGVSDYNIKETD